MRILLIAGHGAGDPGAIGNGYEEASLTRDVVLMLYLILCKYAIVDVFDTSKKMSNYLYKGKDFDFTIYDYVLEIHFNAYKADTGDGRVKGTEILVHPTEKTVGVETKILESICSLGFTNRGIKERTDLIVMNTCKGKQGVSYALLELCFIDDKDDMTLYTSNKDKVVSAIADGIVRGFGLTKKEGFTDIDNCYGKQEIIELANVGIIKGKSESEFAPKEPITREDMAIVIRNTIKYITGK